MMNSDDFNKIDLNKYIDLTRGLSHEMCCIKLTALLIKYQLILWVKFVNVSDKYLVDLYLKLNAYRQGMLVTASDLDKVLELNNLALDAITKIHEQILTIWHKEKDSYSK